MQDDGFCEQVEMFDEPWHDFNSYFEYDEEEYNWDDFFKNATPFRILRGKFPDEQERDVFNKISNNIRDDIIQTAKILSRQDATTLDKNSVCIRLKNLPHLKEDNVIKKANKLIEFLKKSKNSYQFTDIVKQVNLNLLYANEVFKQMKYPRDKNVYAKDKQFGKLLYPRKNRGKSSKERIDTDSGYFVFTFIFDAMNLLEIIDFYLGNYNKEKKSGYLSRAKFNENGRRLFNELFDTVPFEDLTEKELIIKTDRIKADNGKKKQKTIKIQYNNSEHTQRKIEQVKKLNEIYNSIEIKIKANNIFFENVNILNDLYIYTRNNYLELINLDVIYNPYDLDIDGKIQKGIDKLSKVKEARIEIYQGSTSEWVPLLIGYEEFQRNDEHLQRHFEDQENIDCHRLWIRNVEFTINLKSLFRVYSRDSWIMHGRYYGALWINLPKILRKWIYINGSDEPLASLDFSGMHPRMAYHLNNTNYDGDIYKIKNYNSEYRKIFKNVCLVGMNAPSERSAICAIQKKILKEIGYKPEQKEVKKWLRNFKKHHYKISNYICSDFGIKAMYYDSLIMQYCLNELMIKNRNNNQEIIYVLPEHDELLCPRDKVEVVKKQMEAQYRKVMKMALVENGKLDKDEPLPDYIKPVITLG